MRHNVARSHSQILHLAEFLLIRGLFLLFLILLDRSAFGRVLASVCEAQLRLSVINCFRNSKRFKAIYFFFAFIFFQLSVGYIHYSCNCVHCVFRGLETFFTQSTFLAQLVSFQKFSALFPPRQFCSDANLNLKCFTWHACLD